MSVYVRHVGGVYTTSLPSPWADGETFCGPAASLIQALEAFTPTTWAVKPDPLPAIFFKDPACTYINRHRQFPPFKVARQAYFLDHWMPISPRFSNVRYEIEKTTLSVDIWQCRYLIKIFFFVYFWPIFFWLLCVICSYGYYYLLPLFVLWQSYFLPGPNESLLIKWGNTLMQMLFSIKGFILEPYNFSILWNLVYLPAIQTILSPLGAYLRDR